MKSVRTEGACRLSRPPKPTATHPRKRRAGFTLMEIMLVVVIIGVLTALFVPNLVGRSDQARRTAVANDLRGIGATLDLYRLDNAHYPSTDQGLEALVRKPSGLPEPMNYNPGGYARKVPTDPWQTPYVYINAGATFELYSLGADGQEGGEGTAADIYYRDL